MKERGKSIFILVCILSLMFLAVYNPSMVVAAKADKKAATKAKPADKLGKANVAFDVNKLSDMSDFDPATWVGPTGDTIKIAYVNAFSGPGALNGQLHIA